MLFSVSVCVPLETFLKQKEINRERERQLSLTRKNGKKEKEERKEDGENKRGPLSGSCLQTRVTLHPRSGVFCQQDRLSEGKEDIYV